MQDRSGKGRAEGGYVIGGAGMDDGKDREWAVSTWIKGIGYGRMVIFLRSLN